MILHQLRFWPILTPETSASTLSPFPLSFAGSFFPPTAPGSPGDTRRFLEQVDRCRVCAGEPEGLTASDDRLRDTDGFTAEFLDDGRGLLTSALSAAIAFGVIFFLGLADGGVVASLFWDFALDGVEADLFLTLGSGGLVARYFLDLASDAIDVCFLVPCGVGTRLLLSLALDGVDAGIFLRLASGGFGTSLLGLASDGVDTGRLLDLASDGVAACPLLGLASGRVADDILLDLVSDGIDPGLVFLGVVEDLETLAFDDEFEDRGGLVGSGTENLVRVQH